jgi:hypothetical protein
MGKMKEVFQAMKDDDWQGTAEEYLKWWIQQQAKEIDKKNSKNKKSKNK